MKVLEGAAFNQEKALEGTFYVIMNLRMDLFQALHVAVTQSHPWAIKYIERSEQTHHRHGSMF